MTTFTELEKKALIGITKDDFYEEGFESRIWSSVYFDMCSFYGFENVNTLKGVIGSLIKKDAIIVYEEGSDSAFELNDSAIEYLKSTGLYDEDGDLI